MRMSIGWEKFAPIAVLMWSALIARAANTVTVTPTTASYTSQGGTLSWTVTLAYTVRLTALNFRVTLPTGWQFVSVSGVNVPQVLPIPGQVGQLGVIYSDIPSSPISFTFISSYPAGQRGTVSLTTIAAGFTDEAGVTSTVTVPDITIAPQPPVITTQPASQVVTAGGNATFTVAATGSGPLTYQWRRNAVPIASATVSTGGVSTTSQSAGFRVALPDYPQKLELDPTFDLPVESSSSGFGTANTIGVQADGKFVIAGDFIRINDTVARRIVRFNADGTAMARTRYPPTEALNAVTFTGSITGTEVRAILVQPDASIVVGGDFTGANGVSRGGIARFTSTGALNTGFSAGAGFNGTVWALARETSGAVIAAGAFTSHNGTNVARLARLAATDGSVDTTYAAAVGTGFGGTVTVLALQPDGKLLCGGEFATYRNAALIYPIIGSCLHYEVTKFRSFDCCADSVQQPR